MPGYIFILVLLVLLWFLLIFTRISRIAANETSFEPNRGLSGISRKSAARCKFSCLESAKPGISTLG